MVKIINAVAGNVHYPGNFVFFKNNKSYALNCQNCIFGVNDYDKMATACKNADSSYFDNNPDGLYYKKKVPFCHVCDKCKVSKE